MATFKLWAQAIQAMLQQSLNIECKLRTVVELVWFDDIKSGNFDMAVGAVVSTLLDPSDYFNAWYKKDGPQNYSGWDNAEFNALMPQIDSEVDPAKRLALIRKAEDILEKEVRRVPDLLGEDQRRLVQLRQRSQSQGLLRHLRRRAHGHHVARQGVIVEPVSVCPRGPRIHAPRLARFSRIDLVASARPAMAGLSQAGGPAVPAGGLRLADPRSVARPRPTAIAASSRRSRLQAGCRPAACARRATCC